MSNLTSPSRTSASPKAFPGRGWRLRLAQIGTSFLAVVALPGAALAAAPGPTGAVAPTAPRSPLTETQYAWALANGDTTGDFVWQATQAEGGYPISPRGQLSLDSDLLSILAQVPGGHGAGLFYWEPEWVPGVGWEPGAGTPNDNLTLFDFQGRALPSIGLFENPTAVCRRGNAYAVPCVIAP